MEFWIRKAVGISPLYSLSAGEPTLTEIDALLAKGNQAGKLEDRDALRLRVLATTLGWGEVQLLERLKGITKP